MSAHRAARELGDDRPVAADGLGWAPERTVQEMVRDAWAWFQADPSSGY